MHPFVIFLATILLFVYYTPVGAQTKDPHAIYETQCGGCHENHAGDFVFERLDLIEDTLVILPTGVPLRPLLENGHGRLASEDLDVLLDFLAFIYRSDRLFETKCGICHDRAKDTARLKLVIRDNTLLGRYTGRDIVEFLENHGRLAPEEVPKIADMLMWQVLTKPEGWE